MPHLMKIRLMKTVNIDGKMNVRYINASLKLNML